MPRHAPLAERVRAGYEAEPNSSCWLWIGATTGHGYGYIKDRGVRMSSHRVMYELERGPIPSGLELDHLCRNTICVNPAHLEPVTHRENILRGMSPYAKRARQTHCLNGHEFTPENTYRYRGRRMCRACAPITVRRLRLKPEGYRPRITHCRHGHELTVENTYVLHGRARHCRVCARRRALAYYHRQRAASA